MIREQREEERERKSERLVPRTATDPDSFLVLITVQGYPNNIPLFLEVTQSSLFPATERTKLKQRESSTQRQR